jgi:hypothetical protein
MSNVRVLVCLRPVLLPKIWKTEQKIKGAGHEGVGDFTCPQARSQKRLCSSSKIAGSRRLLYNFILISEPPRSCHPLSCSFPSSPQHFVIFHILAGDTVGIQQSLCLYVSQVL